MYDRAPRVLTQPTTGTNHDIGPGSYEPDRFNNKFSSRHKIGYAPFLSMSLRESFLTIKDEFKIAAPGPGTYDPRVYDHTKGASTLANKEQRFYEKPRESPGPGSYNLSKPSDWLKNKHALQLHQGIGNKEQVPAKAQLEVRRKSDPPSIPSPGQAFGFEDGPDGTLQKQKVPDRDGSLGPAFYKINYNETEAVKKYKGVHFGKMTSKREVKTKDEDNPGPGQYDPYKPSAKTHFDLMIEERKQNPIEAKLPRYHEIVTLFENKKAVPGPGHYQIKSQFEPEKVNHDATLRPSFGSQAKRFLSTCDLSPAPGSYDDPRHSLETCNRISGLKKSPFGQTSVRFAKEHHVKRTPGPGTYNYLDLATDLRRKAVFSRATKGGFGSTTHRTAPLNQKDDEFLPGPSHYVVKSAPTPRIVKKQAVFESTSNRFSKQYSKGAPPPGSYEVARSFDKTQGRVLYNESLVKKNRKINGGFLSSTKRFSQPRDVIVRKTETENPGPGHYAVKNPVLPGGNLVTKEERFKTLKSDVPGPGTYQLSPLIQHSVLRSTFNATLNNPVAVALEEMSECKTPNLPFSITA